MIDVDLRLEVADGRRAFALEVAFASQAPVVALYGASGGGKSLTLRAIAGLLRLRAGHVRIAGRTLADTAAGIDVPAPQRALGVLFQDYALFPHLSVRDNVAFGLGHWARRPSTEDRARVDAQLERFGLTALARSRPATLSGGQRQRVALARALVCRPAALLLDEPFAALNPMLRDTLRAELAEVRRQAGIPMLMITHDVDDVIALADVAYRIEEGRVVREVDLERASSRDLAHRALLPERPDPPPRPQAGRLRALLTGRGDE